MKTDTFNMKSNLNKRFFNKLIFSLSLLIAVSLMIIGAIIYFSPVQCESSFIVVACALATIGQQLTGLVLFVPGIILLLFSLAANSHHRILAIIGISGILLSIITICWIGFVYSHRIFSPESSY